MEFFKFSLNSSIKSSWIILKLVIPIYILADILYYYNTLSYVSFIVKPFTSFLGLPPEASLSIISGMFLNLYAAVAFAAPLKMSVVQWSVLAVFLGVCHSLIVESAIMKKLGISNLFSYSLRFFVGLIAGYVTSLLPNSFFSSSISNNEVFHKEQYHSLNSLLFNSFENAVILSIKIIILITVLIFIMNFIKNLEFIKNSKKNISKSFSIIVGLILGITYGAGILITESSQLKKQDLFFIATFLMICHAVIEDTLLFVIFGADFTVVLMVRIVFALLFAYGLSKFYFKDNKDDIISKK
jgi:hypothetical protein